MHREIKIGIVITYITLIFGNLVSFIYTPFMISKIGQTEYGLISLVNSIIAYISLIDSGIGSSIVRYNSACIAKNDYEKQSRINGMFLKMFLLLSLVCIGLGVILNFFIDDFFSLYSTYEVDLTRKLLIVASLNLALSFPLNVFSSIILAFEKFTFCKTLNMIKTFINPLISVCILLAGGKSLALLGLNLTITIFFGLINIFYCFICLKIKISFKKLDLNIVKEIFTFSFYIFLSMLAYQIYWNTDQFIIGRYIGASSIAIYAIAMSFYNYFNMFSNFGTEIFLPRYTKMFESSTKINDVLNEIIKISRIQLYISCFIFYGFIIIGEDFIKLWVGDTYAYSYIIAIILMIPQIISIIQSLFATILQSLNKHKFKSLIYLSMALVNILLSLYFVADYGVIGCAIGTLIGMLLNAIINNLYYKYSLKINMNYYWLQIIKSYIPITLLSFVIYIFVHACNITMCNYFAILFFIFIYGLLYIVVIYFCLEKKNKIYLVERVRKFLQKFNFNNNPSENG